MCQLYEESLKVQSEHLTNITSQLASVLSFKSAETKCHQLLKVDLVTLDTKQDTLKKELEQLSIRRERLHNLLFEIDENLVIKQSDISRLKE